MCKRYTNDLPLSGETSKSNSNLEKSATAIVAKKYDYFTLTKRCKKQPVSKNELTLFQNQEKEAYRRKAKELLIGLPVTEQVKLEALINGAISLGKRHILDLREVA